jgi:hypothetical protein
MDPIEQEIKDVAGQLVDGAITELEFRNYVAVRIPELGDEATQRLALILAGGR